MYLTCTVNYWDDDDESPRRVLRKRTIFCRAVNYTEGEAIATRWAQSITDEEFTISPIKELDVVEIVGSGSYFYKVDCKYHDYNESGKDKVYKHNILFIDESDQINEVTQKAMKYLQKQFLRFDIPKITVLNIECEIDNSFL